MKRVFAIDIPLIAALDDRKAQYLFSSMDAMRNIDSCLLLAEMNDLLELLITDNTQYNLNASTFLRYLTDVETKTYNSSDYSPYITHQPTMTDDAFASATNQAILYQMAALHSYLTNPKADKFLLMSDRWSGQHTEIQTSKDHNAISHPVLLIDQTPLNQWLQARKPQYVAGRHHSTQYATSRGAVSTFMAGNNPQYAQSLLDRAYLETESDVEYPQYLYTYDHCNACFVQFRSDNNAQYHGMDLADVDSRIPSSLRKKYHK